MISLTNINLKKKISCLVCGPDTTYYSKFFVDNFLYVDLNKNIFSKELIFESVKCFFIYIKKFKINYINLRLIFTLSCLIPIIRKKKIKKIVCFFDYSLIGKAVKKILGNEIILIGFQHSMRGAQMNRKKLISGYDYYFQWDEFKEKKNIKKCKFINFGSLKSHIMLEKLNNWKILNRQFSKVKNLILISTFGNININFEKKYFRNLKFNEKIKKAELIYKNLNKNKISIENERECQALEYILICHELKKVAKKFNLKLKIISRYEESALNFMEKSSKRLYQEKIFFDSFFDNYEILSANFYNKIKILFKYKSNSIIYTNVSSLGKELLAMNFKTIFYSFISNKIHNYYYDRKSIFCCLKKDSSKLEKKINFLKKLNLKRFLGYKKKTKITFNSFEPSKKNLTIFLNLTGLKVNKKFNFDEL